MIAQESINITNQTLKLISHIDEFKGKWGASEPILPQKELFEKWQSTFVESVASSMRLRGNSISDRTVAEVIKSRTPDQSFATNHEQEAAGYADAVEVIHRSWKIIPFDERGIFNMHRRIFKYATWNVGFQNQYKSDPNPITINGADGTRLRSPIKTASPDETPKLMVRLTQWMCEQLESEKTHPLLAIAKFIAAFLAIHPFSDGNFRLGHLLAQLLMRKAGYGYMPYGSWEHTLEENREKYFPALFKIQESLKTTSPAWDPWFIAFLTPLFWQVQTLQRTLETYQAANLLREAKRKDLPELSVRIMEYVQTQKRVDMGDMITMTSSSRNTLKAHFRRLVEMGLLDLHGGGRGAWYTLRGLDR